MSVFVLIIIDVFGDSYVKGVYSTYRNAESAGEKIVENGDEYIIEEYTLDN